MPISFIHLSDIHFGQEKGSDIYVHDDVKEELLKDAARVVESHVGSATGVIVTGDIAYGGKPEEYQAAGVWLDRLTAAIGCAKTSVQVVPGNHDIDRGAISSGCQLMIDKILEEGKAKLDSFLATDVDREVLYGRFEGYRSFAEAYNCPLDGNGGLASDRPYELAPHRTLRFIGLNTALICSANDKKEEGHLLLGARQHVLPRNSGEELVVLAHHPLHWLRDSAETLQYLRSRARVFISGHEHNPSLEIEQVKPDSDLMKLAAGATVPPRVSEGYTYTYNLLVFDWDSDSDGLRVTVVPRAWSPADTEFVEDNVRLGESTPTFVLGCPNFKRKALDPLKSVYEQPVSNADLVDLLSEESDAVSGAIEQEESPVQEAFALLLLRFFRDLTPAQRHAVLWRLQVVPETLRRPLTHSVERHLVDSLRVAERLKELEAAINEIQNLTEG